MGQIYPFENTSPDLMEPVNMGQAEILERAVGKLIVLGEKVGVSADLMIQLLESGLSVAELLEYLGVRNGTMAGNRNEKLTP